jgi:hypothetical protein
VRSFWRGRLRRVFAIWWWLGCQRCLGTPTWGGTYGYGLDWNTVVGGMWNAMPVEDPMAAMLSNGAVGIGSGLVYNPCMDAMDCH